MILAAGLGTLTAAITGGHLITPVDYINIAISIVAGVTVYLIPDLSAGVAKYAKTIVAFSGAALMALAVIVSTLSSFGGVTTADWLNVLLAGLAAIGVAILPNEAAVQFVTEVPASRIDAHGNIIPA